MGQTVLSSCLGWSRFSWETKVVLYAGGPLQGSDHSVGLDDGRSLVVWRSFSTTLLQNYWLENLISFLSSWMLDSVGVLSPVALQMGHT